MEKEKEKTIIITNILAKFELSKYQDFYETDDMDSNQPFPHICLAKGFLTNPIENVFIVGWNLKMNEMINPEDIKYKYFEDINYAIKTYSEYLDDYI